MFKALILTSILTAFAQISITAHAILPPIGGESHRYKLFYSATDTEQTLMPLVKQVVDFTWSQGIYTKKLRPAIHESGRQFFVDIEADDATIAKIRSHFTQFGVTVVESRERWINPASESLQKTVLTEGNQILVEFAHAILQIRPGENVSRLIANFKIRFEAWEEKTWPVGENPRTAQTILQTNDLYTGARREYSVLEKMAQSRSVRDNSKFEDRIREIRQQSQPILNLDIQGLEQLKAKLPHLSNILSEQQAEQAYNNGLSVDRKHLEARLSLVDQELGDLSNVRSLNEFNKDTYEVLASHLLRRLNKLETLVTEFEIVDALNRNLAIWDFLLERGLHYDVRYGAVMFELLNHLAGYQGLHPYYQLLLNAMIANAHSGESRKPTDHEINLYAQMVKIIPTKPYYKESNIKVAVMHYGPLFNPIGLVDVGVIEGLEFIDSWFKAHGLKTVDWSKVSGIDLDTARQALTQSRADYLEAHGMNGCETLLDGFFRRKKKDK